MPPPPPPLEDEPPQAAMKMIPESIRHISTRPSNFLRRGLIPTPSNAKPPTGNHIANKIPRDCGVNDEVVVAVV